MQINKSYFRNKAKRMSFNPNIFNLGFCLSLEKILLTVVVQVGFLGNSC